MAAVQASSADKYHSNSHYQEKDADKLLSKVQVSPGSLILDLGCGTGYFATVLSEMVGPEGKVVAVDPDAERIKIAKEKNAKPNIDYLVADDQSFPGDGYNLIVSGNVIHWIKDKKALLERIYDKLAVGGKFAFVTLECPITFQPVTKKAFSDLIDPNFVENLLKRAYFVSNAEYQALAVSTGFKVFSADIVSCPMQWQSVEEFLEFWIGVSHNDTWSVNEKALHDFKEHYESQLISDVATSTDLYMVSVKHS